MLIKSPRNWAIFCAALWALYVAALLNTTFTWKDVVGIAVMSAMTIGGFYRRAALQN